MRIDKSSSKSLNAVSLKKSKSPNAISRVRIEGEGRDEFGKRYFKFSVEGTDHDIPPFSVDQIFNDSSQLFTSLANAGWNGFTKKTRNAVLERLERRKLRPSTFNVATRLGWNSGAYVFPDKIFGGPRKPLEKAFGGLDQAMLEKYRRNRTLSEWQHEVADLCDGNSRLMFGVSLAFTGPILPLVKGPKGGGFQIWGDPETGKTTAAMVTGSVWGCHRGERREKGFTESWNSTSGKVEVTALAHNDALLILDETKRAGKDDRDRANVVTSVAFGLAEMTEKERLTHQRSARCWRCYFLSTSNFSLRELGRRGSVVIDEANRGRMADIPLPEGAHGIYEKLHGFANGEELSDKLQERCRKYFGIPAQEFIRKLNKERQANAQEPKDFLNAARAAYRKALTGAVEAESLKKPLGRSSGRFATVFAAGSLAIKYGILPWSRKRLLRAIVSCQLGQLRQTDDEDERGIPTTESLRVKLVQYLNDHHTKFMHLNKKRPQLGTDKIDSVPGYRDKIKGERWYYLTADQLKTIIGAGESARVLKQTLVTEGLLAQKTKGKFVVQRKIFSGGKRNKNHAWVYAFKVDILKR
jgi:uncharacterized protein (DUF927 family)